MAKKKKSKSLPDGAKLITRNKRATYDYSIDDRFEAGIALLGSEVKSIRAGKVSIAEAYADFIDDELFLFDAHIAEYPWSHQFNHAPKRLRKLLMHKRELAKISQRIVLDGYAFIPMALYFKRGFVKVQLGLGKGKKRYDKRHDLKKQTHQREMSRYY